MRDVDSTTVEAAAAMAREDPGDDRPTLAEAWRDELQDDGSEDDRD